MNYACKTGAKDTLTDTPAEILGQLKESVNPGMSEDREVTPALAEYVLGLTEAQFGEYVESAYEAAAMISTFAGRNR